MSNTIHGNGDALAYALTQYRHSYSPAERYRMAILAMEGTDEGRNWRRTIEAVDGLKYPTLGDLNRVASECYAQMTEAEQDADHSDAIKDLEWSTVWA